MSKHALGRFSSGYNYRGYCLYRKNRRRWFVILDDDTKAYFRTRKEWMRHIDCIEDDRRITARTKGAT